MMISGDKNNNNNSKGIRIERYVPTGIDSLQSDVPGYYGRSTNNNSTNNTNDGTINSDPTDIISGQQNDANNKKSNDYRGPICWKCNGTGINNKKRPRSELSSYNDNSNNSDTTTTTTTITTTVISSSHTTGNCCSVCTGIGRIESKRINNANNKSNDNKGLITRGRQTSIKHYQYNSGPQPVGYGVPYWGDIVKKATYNCVDQYIDPETTAINDCKSKDSGSCDRPVWIPKQNEQLCNLVGEWRILQKVKSHRWTTDDLVTAYVAAIELSLLKKLRKDDTETTLTNKGTSSRYLDLGTGNGSVLQMVLWSSMKAQQQQRSSDNKHEILQQEPVNYITYARGLEARSEAMKLAQRSIQFNIGGNGDNDNDSSSMMIDVQVVHTDFRSYFQSNNDTTTNHQAELFDLITGTPPYFRVDFEVVETKTTTTCEKIPADDSNQTNNYEGQKESHDFSEDTNEDMNNNNNATTTTTTTTKHVQNVVQSAIIRQGGMPTSYQSAPARCEFRGGIEEYCSVALQQLQPNTGRFIVCLNYLNHHRALTAFRINKLYLHKIYYIQGKLGRNILFCVYVLSKQDTTAHEIRSPNDDTNVPLSNELEDQKPYEEIHLAVRDYNGNWTQEYKETVLQFMGIPTPP